MSPYVSHILAECPDSLVVFSKGEGFMTLRVVEAAKHGPELAAEGYLLAGAVARLLDGNIGAVSEPGCGEVIDSALAVFLRETECKPDQSGDSLAWLEALGRLEDPR